MHQQCSDHDALDRIEHAIMQIGWLGQRQFMQLLADERFDLTIPQFQTLLHLDRFGSSSTMSDLARATHQSAASLTGIIDRLLEKRLVARGRSEDDRRQVVVHVTEAGRTLLVSIKQAHRVEIQAALAHVQPVELEELLRLLNTMLEGMLLRAAQTNHPHTAE